MTGQGRQIWHQARYTDKCSEASSISTKNPVGDTPTHVNRHFAESIYLA